MKKTHCVVLLLFLFSGQLFSQVIDRAGYVITSDNDTLYGKIDYNVIQKSKKVCRFTNEKGTNEYTPAQIKGFFFDRDKYYTSRIVNDKFLQVLVTGELSLYKDGAVYYLEKIGNKALKLAYTEIKDTIDGEIVTREDLTWKGYVNLFIYDCIKDQQVLNNLKMVEPDLTRLAIKYNVCRGTEYTDYLSRKAWSRVQIGVSSGITRSKININNVTGFYNYLPDKYVSYDQSFGLSLIFSSPRFMKRVAIQSEIGFIKSDFFSEVIKNAGSATIYNDTYVRLRTISFPQSIRYTLADRDYRLFLNLGFVFANNLHSNTALKSELKQGNEIFLSSDDGFLIIVKQPGYWGGLAFQKPYNKFSADISLRYSRLKNFMAGNYGSNITRLSLSLIISTK